MAGHWGREVTELVTKVVRRKSFVPGGKSCDLQLRYWLSPESSQGNSYAHHALTLYSFLPSLISFEVSPLARGHRSLVDVVPVGKSEGYRVHPQGPLKGKCHTYPWLGENSQSSQVKQPFSPLKTLHPGQLQCGNGSLGQMAISRRTGSCVRIQCSQSTEERVRRAYFLSTHFCLHG